jgi:Domain of unknown function (DUF6570)
MGQVHAWVCFECLSALQKHKVPPLCLANHMWIGPIPFELKRLTIPEQLLIAFHFPRCYVFKLFPKGAASCNPDTLQCGMAGNVTTYPLNMPDIVSMIIGGLMPHKPDILASVIAVTFIGLGHVPRNWLKSTFRVRRSAVFQALQWLQANNTMYRDITISEELLQLLPVDAVPDVILANFHQEEDAGVVEMERASYVPGNDDDHESPNVLGECLYDDVVLHVS